MQNKSLLQRVWMIIYPILLYLGIYMLVSFVGSSIILTQLLSNVDWSSWEELYEVYFTEAYRYIMHYTLITHIIAVPLLYRSYIKDRKKLTYTVDKGQYSPFMLIIVAIAGACACIGGNLLIYASNIQVVFNGYSEVADTIYNSDLLIQILAVGVAAPIAEELMFRGLIYNRLKLMLSGHLPVIAAAGIFAFYHFNATQGIYSFCLGLIMIFIYEQFKSLAAPIVFHIAANMTSIIVSLMKIQVPSALILTAVAVAAIIIAGYMIKLIRDHVHVTVTGKTYEEHHGSDSWTSPPGGFNQLNSFNSWNQEAPEEEDSSQTSSTGYSVDDYYPDKSADDEQ